MNRSTLPSDTAGAPAEASPPADHRPASGPAAGARRVSPCFSSALRRASRRVGQLYDSAIGASGLRSTQFSVLAELASRRHSPPSLAELAEVLVLDRSALGHNLRPLERDGFVRLQPGADDRRVRRIQLTDSGLAKFREARGHWRRAQARFAEVIGEDESAALRAALLAVAYEERLALPAEAAADDPVDDVADDVTDTAGAADAPL